MPRSSISLRRRRWGNSACASTRRSSIATSSRRARPSRCASLAGTYLRPRVRGRAQLGWRLGGFEAVGTFNYTDTYEDATGDRTVDYSTTFDALIEYRFADKTARRSRPPRLTTKRWSRRTSRRQSARYDWLSGVAVRAGVLNIFDDRRPSPITSPVTQPAWKTRASASSSSASRRSSSAAVSS